MASVRTSFYLSERQQAALRRSAKRLGKSQTEVLRAALDAWFARIDPPRPKSIGMGEDRELAARDTERWLKRRWAGR